MSKRQISLRFIRYYPWFWWGRGTMRGGYASYGLALRTFEKTDSPAGPGEERG